MRCGMLYLRVLSAAHTNFGELSPCSIRERVRYAQVSYAPHHMFQFTAARRAASVLLELLWLALLAWMEPFESFLPTRTGAVAVATGVYIVTQVTDVCAFERLRPRDTEWNAYVAAKRITHYAIAVAITVSFGASIAALRRCALPVWPSKPVAAPAVFHVQAQLHVTSHQNSRPHL